MKNLITVAVALLVSTSSYGYTLNAVAEAGARWRNFPVSMKLNPTNSGLPESEVQRVLSQAMSKWNTGVVKTVLEISSIDYSVTAAHGMDQDGVNSITFSDSFREDSNGFDPDVTVAVGGQYGDGSSMVDAFVVFNAESVAWNTDTTKSTVTGIYGDDLETIALHELGHVLGLGHSADTSAVMSGKRTAKTLRELTPDDIEGGKYVTGSAEASGTGNNGGSNSSGAGKSAGCGTINSETNSANISGMLAMMLIPVAVLVFARRRVMETM